MVPSIKSSSLVCFFLSLAACVKVEFNHANAGDWKVIEEKPPNVAKTEYPSRWHRETKCHNTSHDWKLGEVLDQLRLGLSAGCMGRWRISQCFFILGGWYTHSGETTQRFPILFHLHCLILFKCMLIFHACLWKHPSFTMFQVYGFVWNGVPPNYPWSQVSPLGRLVGGQTQFSDKPRGTVWNSMEQYGTVWNSVQKLLFCPILGGSERDSHHWPINQQGFRSHCSYPPVLTGSGSWKSPSSGLNEKNHTHTHIYIYIYRQLVDVPLPRLIQRAHNAHSHQARLYNHHH